MANGHQSADFLDLSARVVLVTGGGQGVGEAICVLCAQHGATVVVNDFHAERAHAVADRICATGGAAVPEHCDVTNFDDVMAMNERIAAAVGSVDILVNNAGNAGPSVSPARDPAPFWETGPRDWEPWIATNFDGVLNTSRAVLPSMVEQEYGRIVTIISDAGRVGEASLAVYGGAKAGAAGFSRGLAKAVGPHGITVNCVALSTIGTPAFAEGLSDPDLKRKLLRGYAVKRFGEPDDVARVVLMLVSAAGSWITGQTYPVDGGYTTGV